MIRIVFATHNVGKLAELRALVADLPLDVVPAADLAVPEIVERGRTLRANAALKAIGVARAAGLPALADDSGLEVDALGGLPGVHSARFAGARATDAENVERLLRELGGVPPERRTARFRCVIAVADPCGGLGCRVRFAEGSCDGVIIDAPRGEGGFGYDPVFLVPALGRTFAELPAEDKNRISHRALAMTAIRALLPTLLADLRSAGRPDGP